MTQQEKQEDWKMYKIKNSQHYRNICAIDLAKHRIESFKKNYSTFQPKSIQPYFESELDKIYKEINKIEI